MQTLGEIRALLAERGLAPRKSLGQNFLIDQNLIRRLVDESGIGPGSLVLEVGPGTGTLSEEILARGADLVACELDRGLAALLRERLPRMKLVEGDCLASKQEVSPAVLEALAGRAFVMVANLPYGAGTPLMAAFMVRHPACRAIYATVQLEVAERLAARAGEGPYGPLSILAQASGRVHRIATLGPECFWPRPEVKSAMVSWVREPSEIDLPRLEAACRRAFASRRKQLGGLLGRDVAWPAGIDPGQRAEALSVDQMVALSRVLG